MSDPINPSHYKDGFSNGAEVIDITENLNFNRGSAIKYLSRAGKKPCAAEIEDLQKAAWYIDREISRIKRADYHDRAQSFSAERPRVQGETQYGSCS